jgi:hypothetical protein
LGLNLLKDIFGKTLELVSPEIKKQVMESSPEKKQSIKSKNNDNNSETPELPEIDVMGALKKAAKVGLTIVAAMAEAEANAPMRAWQCRYCGQVIYSKRKPSGSGWCPSSYMAGPNAGRVPHIWNSVN